MARTLITGLERGQMHAAVTAHAQFDARLVRPHPARAGGAVTSTGHRAAMTTILACLVGQGRSSSPPRVSLGNTTLRGRVA